MIFLKFFPNILFFTAVSGYSIEYYPSQSLLDGVIHSKLSKNHVENKHNDRISKPNLRILDNHGHLQQDKNVTKRAVDPIFHGYPKTREELWHEHFLNESVAFDQTPSLIQLIHNITLTYLNDCTPVILYDNQIKSKESYLFQNLLKSFPVSYVHGYINDKDKLQEPALLVPIKYCLHYIIFLSDIKVSAKILGKQSESKVVLVASSSQWTVQEFLTGTLSRMFVNLLVIGNSFKDGDENTLEAPYILYTHKLYTDGLGASQPVVLASWSHGKYSRDVNLFPLKMTEGYSGHRFVVAAANQPPFVFRKIISDSDGGNPRVKWDGVEIRLLKMLATKNNFSIEIKEPQQLHLGPGPAVEKEILTGKADIGVAGMYQTIERLKELDLSFSHSQDCAVFITLMSTALPRYRAILGPFHWHVWLALTLTYLFGMFPLAFSDKHTLRHLINNSGEVENMFWYVFGTFTNCFTFVGKNSWSKTDKLTTRLLIGWYWIFTIIITSCYTGSIIAFVTLPVFPETVDTVDQLLDGFYRVGTLDRGGWEKWFVNSSDPKTKKLLRKLELVASVEDGIRNTTKAFFWPHAFLGSKAELQFLVQANFSAVKSKRAVLHISNECFVPFGVSMGFPKNSLYTAKLSSDIRRMIQSGLLDKIVDEVKWETQRTSTGKLLAAGSGSLNIHSAEEKGLTLEDTQGMFLLLGAGFLIAATALVSEWMGGFTRRCRFICKQKKEKQIIAPSQEELISTAGSDELKIISGDTESHMPFDDRTPSAGSKDTLEGQVIHVTEETIMVHERLSTDDWDSRRSSSMDLDREVNEIFEKDRICRGIVVEEVNNVQDEDRNTTVSKGAFGDHLTNDKND